MTNDKLGHKAQSTGEGRITSNDMPPSTKKLSFINREQLKLKPEPIKKRTKAEESELIYNAFSKLAAVGRRLSVAESFTGGLISSFLITLPGASAFFHEGAVAYSDVAKINRLSVKPETIKRHTAVSVHAAYEMALGLLSDPAADLVVATTGYSGPSAPSEDLIGQCCIAVGDRSRVDIYKYQFSGGRENIMRNGALEALTLLTELLDKKIKN